MRAHEDPKSRGQIPPGANSKHREGANETCLTFSLEGTLKHYHSFYDSIEMKIMTQFLFEIEWWKAESGRGLGFEQQYNSISEDFDSTCT